MASTIRITSGNIAAAGVVANVLAGNRFEFLPRMSHVAIYMIAHVSGDPDNIVGVTNLATATVSFGNVVLADAAVVPPSDRGVRRNEHLMVAGIGDGGDRLIISLTNGTAIAIEVVLLLEITDL